MNSLEKKRKLLEFERVKMARLELEFKKEEKEEELVRIGEAIEKQKAKEFQLKKELGE